MPFCWLLIFLQVCWGKTKQCLKPHQALMHYLTWNPPSINSFSRSLESQMFLYMHRYIGTSTFPLNKSQRPSSSTWPRHIPQWKAHTGEGKVGLLHRRGDNHRQRIPQPVLRNQFYVVMESSLTKRCSSTGKGTVLYTCLLADHKMCVCQVSDLYGLWVQLPDSWLRRTHMTYFYKSKSRISRRIWSTSKFAGLERIPSCY